MDRLRMMGDEASFRSRCSIARTLDLVGDKWTLLLIRDLMWHGKHTFQSLQRGEEKIPTNILSQRLKKLEQLGLITKEPYQERPVRYRYDLTAVGKELEPVLIAVMNWGRDNLGGGFFDPQTGTRKQPCD